MNPREQGTTSHKALSFDHHDPLEDLFRKLVLTGDADQPQPILSYRTEKRQRNPVYPAK